MEGIQTHSSSTCSTVVGHSEDEKPQPVKFTSEAMVLSVTLIRIY